MMNYEWAASNFGVSDPPIFYPGSSNSHFSFRPLVSGTEAQGMSNYNVRYSDFQVLYRTLTPEGHDSIAVADSIGERQTFKCTMTTAIDPAKPYTSSLYVNVERIPHAWYSVTAMSTDSTMGSVSGGDMYPDSSIVTLAATPYDGYKFLMWNDGDTTNPRQVFVTSDTVFAAVFRMSDTTGINHVDMQHHLATIYPNPTDGDVTISVVEPSTVTVIDAAGRVAIPTTQVDSTFTIRRNSLTKGIYFVIVASHNAAALEKMIVK
jgi:hypothetical protein